MADGLKERVEKLRSRSEAAIAENDKTEQGKGKKKKKKPSKPEERVGVGRDHSNANADRLIAQIRERLEATTDAAKREDLKARIKALQATRVN